jgi:hypothetical protein
MPYYTCSNAACSTAGQTFSLTGAGQTYCPQCYTANALTAAPTPVVAPTTQTRTVVTSNAMDAAGKDAAEVDDLIAKWDLNTVSDTEAKKTKDYLYTLGAKSKRIDREGPVTNGQKVATHGKFRLQFGTNTYAGVWIKVNEILDAAVIRRAFRESMVAGRYVEVYLG